MQKRWEVRNKKVCQSLILCYPICTSQKREAAETTDTEKYNFEYIFSDSYLWQAIVVTIFLRINLISKTNMNLRARNSICLKKPIEGISAHFFHLFCYLQNTETKGKRSQWVVSFWTHKTVLDRLRYMRVWGTVCSTHKTYTHSFVNLYHCVFY